MISSSRLDSKKILSESKSYGEIRHHINRDFNLGFLNGSLQENSTKEREGVSARSFNGGRWGFASSSIVSNASAAQALGLSLDNAKLLSSLGESPAKLKSSEAAAIQRNFASAEAQTSNSKWTDFLSEVDAYIQKACPKLQSRVVKISSIEMEKSLWTSSGSESYSLIPRSHLIFSFTVDSKDGPVSVQNAIGGLGQTLDQSFLDKSVWQPKVDKLYEQAVHKSEGIYIKGGVHEVILAPTVAGILAHEAVGHTVEADLVLGGSVAGEAFGGVVASDLISLTDFAHTAFGKTTPQPIFIDDEGVKAQDTLLIEKGKLTGYMHNRETAAHFGHEATGHGRAFAYDDEPLIRMRNTAILPGGSELSQMIDSIEHGYLLEYPANGQADTTGEFMFGVSTGREIKNGKLGRSIRDATISGIAFEMLKTVTAVSNEFQWYSRGYCGKKQPMPVGIGGPSIQCKVQIGGQ